MIRAMKKASIVSIGNELLTGRTDTNTSYLSSELLSIGIPVVSSYTVGDDTDAIVRAPMRKLSWLRVDLGRQMMI
jgi:molybdopterin-biosynthesis enzyme MoeA-like protein